jgi:hypothetical protein
LEHEEKPVFEKAEEGGTIAQNLLLQRAAHAWQ